MPSQKGQKGRTGPNGPVGSVGPVTPKLSASICLCMIMKNEEKIITKCLESVAPFIDYWVINDNGSTDNTVQVVKDFFKDRNIKGSLLTDPWVGFAHNRSLVFKEAEEKSGCDWMYVIDADDYLTTPLFIPAKPEGADSFIINIQEGPNIMQTRQQLFKVGLDWLYAAIVHEYPASKKVVSDKLKIAKTTEIVVKASRGGDRSKDPLKYWRDAIMMEKDLQRVRSIPKSKLPHWEKGLEERYLYYICQSWHDFGHYYNCIKWADQRVQVKTDSLKSLKASIGFKEEVYRAYLLKARAMRNVGAPYEHVVEALNACIKYDEYRAEGYFDLVNVYENENKWTEADDLIKKVVKIKRPGDKLFIVEDYTYKFGAKKEAAWIAYKLGNYEESFKICDKLAKDLTNQDEHRMWAHNIKYKNIKYILPSRLEYKESMKNVKNNPDCKKVVVNFSLSGATIDDAKKTITSWLNCCSDKHEIDQWYFSGEIPVELFELFPFLQSGKSQGDITLNIDCGWVFFHKDLYIGELQKITDAKIVYLNRSGQLMDNRIVQLVQKGESYLVPVKTVVKMPYCLFKEGQGVFSFERVSCLNKKELDNLPN